MYAPAHISYARCPDATPEAELSALAAVYCFLLIEKGASNDLTGTSTKEWTTSQDKKGIDSGNLHGN